ncbi:MAG: PhnD/SsuA/transferrin family substrate-binding protein [Motiliproteus sp.]
MKNNNKASFNFNFFLAFLLLLEGVSIPLMAAEDPLVLGVFPRRNATLTTRLFTPMAEYLSQQLGREVTLVTAKDFPSFWRGVTDRSYDIVHYNQYHYIISADTYQVIAHNKEFGRSDVAGSLYVRTDSGITEVSQLKGRRIVFGGGEDAMMSYILPRYLLLEAGLDRGDYDARFANSPPNALMALYFNQAEASGAGDILINLPVVKQNLDTTELTHLAKTKPLLHLPWAVKQGMNPELRNRIQQSLLQLETTDAGRAILKQAKMTGFGAANDADYDPHRQIVAKVAGSVGKTL